MFDTLLTEKESTMNNLEKTFYKTNRINGMRASLALEFARKCAARYVAEVESLPYGKERSKKHAELWPKRRAPVEYNPASDSGKRWVENASGGLRVRKAHDVVNLEHTGWYCDSFCGDTTHGVVLQIPARNGKPQYFPGYSDPYNNDCAYVDFSAGGDDERQAARNADRMAEQEGESQREYSDADQAGQRYAEAMEESETAREHALALIRDYKAEVKAGKMTTPTICQAIKSAIAEAVAKWRAGKSKAQSIYGDAYLHTADLKACFASSAGVPVASLA